MQACGYGRSSLCARKPRLAERALYKIVVQHQFADLVFLHLAADLGVRRFSAASAFEHIGSTRKELLLPRTDLIGMYFELLSKLRNRSIVLQGSQRHLRLEGRCVVPAGSLLHLRS